MEIDRLGEIDTASAQRNSDAYSMISGLEMGDFDLAKEDFMGAYFDQVGELKKTMSSVEKNVEDLEVMHSQALAAVNADSKNNTDVQNLSDETKALINKGKNTLKKMEADNKAFEQNHSGSTEVRIRVNMHSTLSRKLLAIIEEFQDVQARYKSKCEERIVRQYKIVKPDASDEEMKGVLSGQSTNIFADQINAGAKNALAEIQDRHNDIRKLEESIRELAELFTDMATMVQSQGELLDQIEFQVVGANKYVASGVTQLVAARGYQKSAQKKKVIAAAILVVILIVIIIIIVVSVKSAS